MTAMTYDICRDRAIEDCVRVLTVREQYAISTHDWHQMVIKRMDVIWPERPRYEPERDVLEPDQPTELEAKRRGKKGS